MAKRKPLLCHLCATELTIEAGYSGVAEGHHLCGKIDNTESCVYKYEQIMRQNND